MPASPWRAIRPAEVEREYLVLLSFLPLRRRWRVPWFLLQTARVARQLEQAPGLITYSFYARPLTGRFWTLSVWEDEGALQAFVSAPPHAAVMRVLVPHMGPTRFVRWTATGAQLPPSWEEAFRR